MAEVTGVPPTEVLPAGEQEFWTVHEEEGAAIAEALLGWFRDGGERERDLGLHLAELGVGEVDAVWLRELAGVDRAFAPMVNAFATILGLAPRKATAVPSGDVRPLG